MNVPVLPTPALQRHGELVTASSQSPAHWWPDEKTVRLVRCFLLLQRHRCYKSLQSGGVVLDTTKKEGGHISGLPSLAHAQDYRKKHLKRQVLQARRDSLF